MFLLGEKVKTVKEERKKKTLSVDFFKNVDRGEKT